MSEEKKNHPEHKYSVTFVSKVGTTSCSYQGQALSVATAFKSYGAVITFKKLIEIKEKKFFFLKFEFLKIIPPHAILSTKG